MVLGDGKNGSQLIRVLLPLDGLKAFDYLKANKDKEKTSKKGLMSSCNSTPTNLMCKIKSNSKLLIYLISTTE